MVQTSPVSYPANYRGKEAADDMAIIKTVPKPAASFARNDAISTYTYTSTRITTCHYVASAVLLVLMHTTTTALCAHISHNLCMVL